MKKIKNIIVATDFSVTSRKAYCYAKQLANVLNAALTIVHVKSDLIMVSDVMITSFPIEEEEALIKEVEVLITEENIAMDEAIVKQEVKIKIINGDPVSALTQLSKNADTDLIVMGTTGLADILTKIFGSVSITLSNKAHCPVILVPRDVKWQPIKHIMFASNYDSMTSEFVNNVAGFALNFHADIDFLNVKNFDPLFEIKQKDIDWDKLIIHDPNLSFEKHTIYGNDTIEQLKKYSEEKGISLMAFASKHRNFWENLVHKSITERSILSTTIPIMVMHLDDGVIV